MRFTHQAVILKNLMIWIFFTLDGKIVNKTTESRANCSQTNGEQLASSVDSCAA